MMDRNQLGRRNLSGKARMLLLGRRYNRVEKPRGGNRKSKDKNPPLISGSVREAIAGEHKCHYKTVAEAGAYVTALESLRPIAPDLEAGRGRR